MSATTNKRAVQPVKVLKETSLAVAQAEHSDGAARGLLFALYDHEIIRSGTVEIHQMPPLQYSVGEAHPSSGNGTSSASAGVIVESIPTISSPAATLFAVPGDSFDADLLEVACSQLGLALDRTFLSQHATELTHQADRRIREVSTIYEIGRAIVSDDIHSLLKLITEKAAKVMDAQACSLMQLNPDSQQLTIAASYGLSEDVVFVTQRALGEGIAGRVAETGEPLLILDSHSDPRLSGLALRPEIGSSMVVPMKDEAGRVIGVLSIRRRRPGVDFTQDDLRLFSVFASQAALALSNKELYDKLSHRIRELSTLSHLTQTVISHLDLAMLLEHVVDDIVNVVNFDRCCIFMLDRQHRRYVPRAFRGYRPEMISNPVRIGEGLIGHVAKEMSTLLETDARTASDSIRGFARQLGANGFLALPMVSKGQSIGVVVADNKPSNRPIHPGAVELLTTFINQTALAIEIAQLSEDREQRYQQMNQLATQTDNILRSIAAAVVVVDTEGNVTRWNRASEEMWGIREDHATRKPYRTLLDELALPEDEASHLQQLVRQVIDTGRSYQGFKIALHPRKKGEIVVNVLVSPLLERGGQRQGAVQIMEDMTREVKMETEIARIRRLADIGQLAAKMAHEVRNPLSSIKGAAQLMRNDYVELAPLREFLDIIIDEVNGLSRITTDMLDFARPMQLDLQQTNVNNLIDRTVQLLGTQLSVHHIEVEMKLASRVPEVSCDPKQIGQVMKNIVINSIQAMPEGGTLHISTTFRRDSGAVSFTFRDTGEGIERDKLQEVFQPFFTTKTKGTGLGLAIVRKIVENHGGTIEVDSSVNKGTAFCVTLPLRPAVSDIADAVRLVEPYTATEVPDA